MRGGGGEEGSRYSEERGDEKRDGWEKRRERYRGEPRGRRREIEIVMKREGENSPTSQKRSPKQPASEETHTTPKTCPVLLGLEEATIHTA